MHNTTPRRDSIQTSPRHRGSTGHWRHAGLCCPLALVAASASASVIHVPSDQPTIKAAITAAISGDEIVVADGTYAGPDNRALNFAGKSLLLRSANGPTACRSSPPAPR